MYPWQQTAWQHCQQAKSQQRLAHAQLISSVPGSGGREFVEVLAQSLLCLSPNTDGQACSHCQACRWLAAGSHPDWYDVGLEEKAKVIKIDQIRALQQRLAKSAHSPQARVVIIEPTEQLHPAAANALLKWLEEPGTKTYFLLLCHHPSRILATIRSRCQILNLPAPSRVQTQALLQAEGVERVEWLTEWLPQSPLLAQTYLSEDYLTPLNKLQQQWAQLLQQQIDPLTVAKTMQSIPTNVSLTAFIAWIDQHIREQAQNQRPRRCWFTLRDHAQQTYQQSLGSSNLQASLLLEKLCCDGYMKMRSFE